MYSPNSFYRYFYVFFTKSYTFAYVRHTKIRIIGHTNFPIAAIAAADINNQDNQKNALATAAGSQSIYIPVTVPPWHCNLAASYSHRLRRSFIIWQMVLFSTEFALMICQISSWQSLKNRSEPCSGRNLSVQPPKSARSPALYRQSRY